MGLEREGGEAVGEMLVLHPIGRMKECRWAGEEVGDNLWRKGKTC